MGSLAEIEAVYAAGRYATAYRMDPAKLLANHSDPDDELLAARIVRSVGGHRQSQLRMLRNWRRNRDHWPSRFYTVSLMSNPVRVLRALDDAPDPSSADDDTHQSWLLLRARAYSTLRDFSSASTWLETAAALPATAWMYCIRGTVAADRDRIDEAIEEVDRALDLRPWYSPAARFKLTLLRRKSDLGAAEEFASRAAERIESEDLAMQRHHMAWEQRDYAGALRHLEEAVRLSPAMEQSQHDWLIARIAHVAFLAGDVARPRLLAEYVTNKELQRIADCTDAGEHRRIILDVPLVVQRHNTCAPASLTSIARYWNRPIEHEEVVEQICLDGTTSYSERKWATEQGWAAREFTVTWPAATALLDAKLPFAFVTTFELNGHLQVAMGYDALTESLIVRDPSSLSMYERNWAELQKEEAPFGPRGLVLVPPEQAHLLKEMSLPDEHLYDCLYELEAALDSHDRQRAQETLAVLMRSDSDHFLTLRGQRALATYDEDPRGHLEWSESMLANHPDDERLQMARLRSMDGLTPLSERLAAAEQYLENAESVHLIAEIAPLLAFTPERRFQAIPKLWRVLDGSYGSAQSHAALANHLWDANQRELATSLYRFASCLAVSNEQYAWSYFLACRLINDVQAGLEHLRARVEQIGHQTPGPARTLVDALELENRYSEATECLAKAERAHADDGMFLLGLADYCLNTGQVDRATELVARAKSDAKRTSWLRRAARLAHLKEQRDEAVQLWREIVAVEPLAMDAHEQIASFLRDDRGPEVAAEYLSDVQQRFPHHIGIGQLLHDCLSDVSDHQALAHLQSFVVDNPDSHWGLRQLARSLATRGDHEQAEQYLQQAMNIGDTSSHWFVARGHIDESLGRREAALESYRRAVAQAIDNSTAVDCWMTLVQSSAQTSTAALDEIFGHLLVQPSSGIGVMSYFEHARVWLDQAVLDDKLETLIAAHPNSFEAKLAHVRNALRNNDVETALSRARLLTDQFPLLPGSWRALANVYKQAGDGDAQIDALQKALALNPRWSECLRELADAYEFHGDLGKARVTIDTAIRLHPSDPVNRGYLAELLWRTGQQEESVRHLKQALSLSPGYRWGWQMLAQWCRDPAEPIKFAQTIAQSRGASADIWLALVDLMPHATISQQMQCVEEALKRRPADVEAHDEKARLLCEAGRYDEALAACHPPLWEGQPPVALRAREAWIHYQSGECTKARLEMLAILADEPDHLWAINSLLGWADEKGPDELLAVSNDIVRRAPNSAIAHGRRGEVLRIRREYASAEKAFRKALEIDPRDRFTLLSLTDLYLDQGLPDEASPPLDALDPHDYEVIVRRGRIAAQSGQDEQVCESLATLLQSSDMPSTRFDELLLDYGHDRLPAPVEQLVSSRMLEPDAGPHVGLLWMKRVGSRMPALLLWRRMARLPASEARSDALVHYVESLAERRKTYTLAFFSLIHRGLLQSTIAVWGAMCFALAYLGKWHQVLQWYGKCPRPDELKSWMLWNTAIAAYRLNRVDLARDAHRRALDLPGDSTSFQHRLHLAVIDALDGEPDQAEQLVEDATGPDWKAGHTFLADVAGSLVAWRRADETDEAYEELTGQLARARQKLGTWTDWDECRTVYHWLLKGLRKRRGGLEGARLWMQLRSG